MNGADAGGVETAENGQPMTNVFGRAIPKAFVTRGADPISHFPSGSFGERNGNQRMKIGFRIVGVVGFERRQKPLRQDKRFAAAGSSG